MPPWFFWRYFLRTQGNLGFTSFFLRFKLLLTSLTPGYKKMKSIIKHSIWKHVWFFFNYKFTSRSVIPSFMKFNFNCLVCSSDSSFFVKRTLSFRFYLFILSSCTVVKPKQSVKICKSVISSAFEYSIFSFHMFCIKTVIWIQWISKHIFRVIC